MELNSFTLAILKEYSLDEEEKENAKNFIKNHKCKKIDPLAIECVAPALFSIICTSYSCGSEVHIRCEKCGEEVDISSEERSNW